MNQDEKREVRGASAGRILVGGDGSARCVGVALSAGLLGVAGCSGLLGPSDVFVVATSDAGGAGQGRSADRGGDAGDGGAAINSAGATVGACGHDCLGGACAAGVCQPFELTRLPAPTFSDMFVDDAAVYVVEYDATNDHSVGGGNPVAYDKRTGAEIGRASDMLAGALELQDRDAIYAFTTERALGTNFVVRYAKANLARGGVNMTHGSNALAGQYGSNGSTLFVTENVRIESIPLPQGNVAVLGPGWVVAADDRSLVWQVDTDAGRAMYVSGFDLSNPTVLRTPPALSPDRAVLSSDTVYYANTTDGLLYASARDGHAMTQLTTVPVQRDPEQMAADGQYVYWADPVAHTVSKVSIHGGPVAVVASGVGVGGAVAVDDTAIYWTTATSIFKLAK